jgi:hypothetical protein
MFLFVNGSRGRRFKIVALINKLQGNAVGKKALEVGSYGCPWQRLKPYEDFAQMIESHWD